MEIFDKITTIIFSLIIIYIIILIINNIKINK